jgi:hypothetical protein
MGQIKLDFITLINHLYKFLFTYSLIANEATSSENVLGPKPASNPNSFANSLLIRAPPQIKTIFLQN